MPEPASHDHDIEGISYVVITDGPEFDRYVISRRGEKSKAVGVAI